MPAVKPFHTSLYLSLAVAIIASGVAGGDLLPELPFVTVFSLLLLGVAYYREGRWELSLRAANIVGLGLGALLGLWAIFQVVRPPTGLAETLPWPASALPYLTPVLMILIPAKLLRSKHMGDYWAMQGLGLLAMALACAMAMDGAFIMLFLLYAVLFVWSLSAFHIFRELGPVQGATVPLNAGRWKGLRLAFFWASLCGAAAVPLFWATPRSGSQWELALNTRGRATTGISDGPVDLNRTGPVDVNQERAFEFQATTPDGQPILDVSPEQRFRAIYLHNYESGRWIRNQFGFQTADRAFSPAGVTRDPRSRMPDLGPGTMHFTFVLNPRLTRTPPLADPVAWQCGLLTPAASRFEDGSYRSWVHRHDGSLDGAFSFDAGSPQYLQAWAPPPQPGYGPVMRVQPNRTEYLTRLPRGLPKLKEFTDRVIERLVNEGKLPQNVLTDVDPDVHTRRIQHHEAIARALEEYLGQSGDFAYSLELTRQDKAIDPVEDFLLNSRSGHCQRFATALVLMLRSQGIPAQMVMGYRGCTGRGDGWYDVREDQSHAWAEVLLPASNEGLMPVWNISQTLGPWWPVMRWQMLMGGSLSAAAFALPPDWKPMRWVTFDPTPAIVESDSTGPASFLEKARQKWEAVLKTVLLAYNTESREQAASAIEYWLIEEDGPFYVGGIAAGLLGLWLVRRYWRKRTEHLANYPNNLRRLVGILASHGIGWQKGQTAQEFAIYAREKLAQNSEVADIPMQIVAAYYAERFGGVTMNEEQRRELVASLKRLAAGL